jgi:hypothetical protein
VTAASTTTATALLPVLLLLLLLNELCRSHGLQRTSRDTYGSHNNTNQDPCTIIDDA